MTFDASRSIVKVLKNLAAVALNDATQKIAVPDRKIWDPSSITVVVVTSATVGSRQIALKVFDTDGTTLLGTFFSIPTQATGLTITYTFGDTLPQSASATASEVLVPIPTLLQLNAGMIFQIVDLANIDAAGDTAAVTMLGEEITIA